MDASLLVAVLVDSGSDGTWAGEMLDQAEALVAPHLVLAESYNVLRQLEGRGRISTHEATTHARHLANLDIELVPMDPFAERIWALRANVTSYDAWYVAVAEAADLPLATLDSRLARANGPNCKFLLPPNHS